MPRSPDLILHHYASSPFSEKIRLVMGRKKLAWKSVIVPAVLPKPDVVTLTGGYRKTPFLQVGADIYCDSALICDVLEHAQPEPCVADFATYHPLWFTRVQVPAMAAILAVTPAVLEWMDRMAALGHGRLEQFSAAKAITVAERSDPMPAGANLLIDSAFQDDHGIPLGSPVTVTPESFGAEATEGELLAATRTHYTLKRSDERAGIVHVHFPRVGYVLRAA